MRCSLTAVLTLMAGVGAAAAQTVSVTAADCRRLVRHQPAPDVAFRPGVDVRGRPVAPADLYAGPEIRPPETFSFDVTVDLNLDDAGLEEKDFVHPGVTIGRITVEAGGRVLFNGQSLDDPRLEALAELCRRRLDGAR
ncbi:MAG: hypothetical protein ACT4P2_12265 [Pseudomonadota bacterium]